MGRGAGWLAAAALTVPAFFAPQFFHVGRTVYLHPPHPSHQAALRSHLKGGFGGGGGGGGLVEARVDPRSPLAAHRMVSYRARVLDLWGDAGLEPAALLV